MPVTVQATIEVKPGQSFQYFGLLTSGGPSNNHWFVQEQVKGTDAWKTLVDQEAFAFEVSGTIRNESVHPRNYRVISASAMDSILLRHVADEVEEILVTDSNKQPMINKLDTGKLSIPGGLSGVAIESMESIEDFETFGQSHQTIAADLNVGEDVGGDAGSGPKFIAAGMFNVIGEDLTQAQTYLAGVIGALSVVGDSPSTYGRAGVMGIIMDGVVNADAAVLAVLDGDSAQTNARAAFGVMGNNSTPGSGFEFGLDLHGAAHDGYPQLPILKADIRMSDEVCFLHGAADPTDGIAGTGAGFAGPGSQYTRVDGASSDVWVNCNTKASPTWKKITRAA